VRRFKALDVFRLRGVPVQVHAVSEEEGWRRSVISGNSQRSEWSQTYAGGDYWLSPAVREDDDRLDGWLRWAMHASLREAAPSVLLSASLVESMAEPF